MWGRIKGSRPSPAMLVALGALLAALAGTAIAGPGASSSKLNAKKVKRIAAVQAAQAVNGRFPVKGSDIADGAVVAPKLGDGAVGAAKLGDGAVGTAKLEDGAVTAAKTAMRWALVDSNGTIVDQSGGISTTAVVGSNYYLDFGANLAHTSIQVTPVFRDADPDGGISAVTSVCGGGPIGATCGEPGTNDRNHLFVFTSDDAGNDNQQAFYVTAF